MRNVLDRLPQREQSEAKDLLRTVVYAPRRSEAVKAREVFARRYRPWYPKAVDVLEDDWERMVAFYDFPEDHWKHLRTTNVVESPFAAVRLRTTAAKRFKRRGLVKEVAPTLRQRSRQAHGLHLDHKLLDRTIALEQLYQPEVRRDQLQAEDPSSVSPFHSQVMVSAYATRTARATSPPPPVPCPHTRAASASSATANHPRTISESSFRRPIPTPALTSGAELDRIQPIVNYLVRD